MKKFYIAGIVVIVINLLLAAIFIPESRAQSDNTQLFTPSRYVIAAALMNVISPHVGGNHRQRNVIVKMDTVTGKTWVLQMYVSGGAEARVKATEWLEVGLMPRKHQAN